MAPYVISSRLLLLSFAFAVLSEVSDIFYNPLDGPLGLFTSGLVFVVVVAERVRSSLSPWSYTKIRATQRH